MSLNSQLSDDIQQLCDKIVRINKDWYDTVMWDYAYFAPDGDKALNNYNRYDFLFTLPDSLYFSYTENSTEMHLNTSVLSDIYDAVKLMGELKPVRWGISCNRGLTYLVEDPWCELLNDISADQLLQPEKHVIDNSDFFNQMNSLLDKIENYWYVPWCSDIVLQAMFERGELVGQDINNSRWVWNLRDGILSMVNQFINTTLTVDGLEYGTELNWTEDDVSDFIGRDIRGVVCCNHVKDILNEMTSLGVDQPLLLSQMRAHYKETGDIPLAYYYWWLHWTTSQNEEERLYTNYGGEDRDGHYDEVESWYDGNLNNLYYKVAKDLYYGTVPTQPYYGPSEYWDKEEHSSIVEAYFEIDYWHAYEGTNEHEENGTILYNTIRLGGVSSTEKPKTSVIYVGLASTNTYYRDDNPENELQHTNVPGNIKSTYMNSDEEGIWKKEKTYSSPFTGEKPSSNARLIQNDDSITPIPDPLNIEVGYHKGSRSYTGFSCNFDSIRIDDYTPALTII